ncbi:MAG TPA: flavodoxin family protein [Ktedonobacterales bacterium]|nr:flavodoxin family protein [Ktedonobacterales bacterium]
MKALVVYDSQYGNTEQIAKAIADTLRALGDVQVVRVNPAHPLDLQGVDLLLVGSPTQGWQPTKAMQDLLANLSPDQLRGVAIACFDTRFQKPRWMTGSAARVMANKFRRMSISPILLPESFFVEQTEGPLRTGELSRAATWARTVLDKVQASHPVG